jgi:hypothetical protein
MEAWGGCVAGALSADEYRAGLLAAGFTDVRVDAKDASASEPCCGEGASAESSCCGSQARVYSAVITAHKPG